MLQKDKSEDLRRVFRLFSRLENGLDPIARIFRTVITEKGLDVMTCRMARLETGETNDIHDPSFIEPLIGLHEKSMHVVKRDFSGHAMFQKALKDAFAEVLNMNVGSCSNAKLMSTFCDHLLKSSGKKLDISKVEEDLDRIVLLFSYLHDKDLFAEIFCIQLAKRLLNQRSTSSVELEKLVISKLKVQCGTQFTSKMEGMMADLAVGSQQRQEFEQHMLQMNSKIDFTVHVLTNVFWPIFTSPDVTLTEEMTKCMNIFKDWHDQKYQRRKLTWVLTQGCASVRAMVGEKTYDLHVTTLQAIALEAFSGGHTLTFRQLSQRLNLEDGILVPLMHSLSCGKHVLIVKNPANATINATDSFCANSDFSANTVKIRIPMSSLHSKPLTSSPLSMTVEKGRLHKIEATIVRIMKARKSMQHDELMTEVISQQFLFKIEPRVVKKRIEALIEREFLERSADDSRIYNYLA